MNIYWQYFKYVVQHKHNVAMECIKAGQFIHAINHDLSKFLPSEFTSYANFFYGKHVNEDQEKMVKADFDIAWLHHQHRNKHHWNYWVDAHGRPYPIPVRYIKQMIADWKGMARKFGDTARDYFDKNRNEMNLHPETITNIEKLI